MTCPVCGVDAEQITSTVDGMSVVCRNVRRMPMLRLTTWPGSVIPRRWSEFVAQGGPSDIDCGPDVSVIKVRLEIQAEVASLSKVVV